MPEEIAGSVVNLVFRNPDTLYSVVQVRSGREVITVTGPMPELSEGEKVAFQGVWMEHPQYGRQFRSASCAVETPTTLSEIERYLASGLIKGVGASTARQIVEAFGEDALTIMGEQPERLMEISGIGRVRSAQISESFEQQHAARRTMMFLQNYGISPGLSAKIHKKYSVQAESLIRANPYRLIDDIDGVGFRTADRIAQSLGIPASSDFRLQAGLVYALQDAAGSSGHTYLPREQLIWQSSRLLHLPEEILEHHVQALTMAKRPYAEELDGTAIVSLPDFYRAEWEIAQRIRNLAQFAQTVMDGHVPTQIAAFEREHHIAFSPTQRAAIVQAAQSGVLVITGGPGTGKTTLINCILHIAGGEETLLAAPTGRAAKRMSEATGRDAKTLHRLLEFGGDMEQFQRNGDNPLDCSMIVVDEMSMVDIFLMRSLLRAIQPGTRIILVGDADQLPPVGPGNVLGDLLQSGAVPHVRLTEIFRQEEQSMIVVNAHRINMGKPPLLNKKDGDFFFISADSPQDAAASIVTLCRDRLPGFLGGGGSGDVQVLSPTRKGTCGVADLNALLQSELNSKDPSKPELAYGDMVFRLHDKVIHIKNDYHLTWSTDDGEEGEGVFNGDVGRVVEVDTEDRLLTVRYDDERNVTYANQQFEELELAYCLSVHKSQGSEFEAVVMPMVGGPPMLLTRNLLYTAVTRARKLVVLVGYERAIMDMVNNNVINRRYSLLAHRLTDLERPR
ncbi:MAG: ATP-dependent RecD-like DNA helicase [Clostridiales bacterium]|nr:ATP-dependent RecD-like DNA helicase [Clostridiales bacterium]